MARNRLCFNLAFRFPNRVARDRDGAPFQRGAKRGTMKADPQVITRLNEYLCFETTGHVQYLFHAGL